MIDLYELVSGKVSSVARFRNECGEHGEERKLKVCVPAHVCVCPVKMSGGPEGRSFPFFTRRCEKKGSMSGMPELGVGRG